MAAGEQKEIHNGNLTKKITPLITMNLPFRQQISELVFGVNIFDLDLGVQVDSVK